MNSEEYRSFTEMISSGGITSYLQPIVDLYLGEIYGYELLARGKPPFFTPDCLFDAARRFDSLAQLEDACRTAALEKAAATRRQLAGKKFFINVSPEVFSEGRFHLDFTMEQLASYGLSGNDIVLEITETASVEDYENFELAIRRYVQEGFSIALDDFGSGHSGLITLVATTPHIMKIDKELVSGLHRSGYKQSLVKAIAEFADSVGSSVLVEGVETVDELRTAYRMGVRYAQGFYFARPAPEPVDVVDEERHLEMLGFMEEYTRHSYSVDLSINRMVARPATIDARTTTGRELDEFFRIHNSVSHVVWTDERDAPLGMITRQEFYSRISGRYGFAVFQNKAVDALVKRDMLVVEEQTDLRVMGKLAMARSEAELYDPVVVVDRRGALVGTITMKKVISRAFDTEVKFATNANPLTSLPGNVVINVWLEELLHREEYTIAYLDLDRFKEFNDEYGFAAGDRMIKLVGELLSEQIQHYSGISRVGHIGGDDFILLFEGPVEEVFFAELVQAFDRRKLGLFDSEDLRRGCFFSTNRRGQSEEIPLVTLSVAIVTNCNFLCPPHPGKLGQSVAHLKKRVKELNAERRTSGYSFERRTLQGS